MKPVDEFYLHWKGLPVLVKVVIYHFVIYFCHPWLTLLKPEPLNYLKVFMRPPSHDFSSGPGFI